ncbi:MAG: hypothetical protein WC023_01435 [Rhodocyclaceae bacterium]
MAIIHLIDAVKHAMLTPLRDAIDAGTSAGVIDIYSGTIPTTAATAIGAQVLLGTLTFSDPCCTTVGTPTAGSLTMAAITQDSAADATGTAAWARISSVTGGVKTTVGDIDITTTGGGGTMQMNTTNIVIGGPILISAFAFSL